MIKNSTLLVFTDGNCTNEPVLIDLTEMASLNVELSRLMQGIENSLPSPSVRSIKAIRAAVVH